MCMKREEKIRKAGFSLEMYEWMGCNGQQTRGVLCCERGRVVKSGLNEQC